MKAICLMSTALSASPFKRIPSVNNLKLWSALIRFSHEAAPRSLKVPSFGKVKIMNVLSDIVVEPIEPHENFNADVAFVYGQLDVSLTTGDEGLLTLSGGSQSEKAKVQVPVKYDLEAKLSGRSSISVAGLEADQVHVDVEEGDVILWSVKSRNIIASSTGGNISCQGVTQGSIQIRTHTGDVTGKRFQGPTVSVTTDSGNISVESTYSDQSCYETTNGSVTLKNLHRQAIVSVLGKGNLNITGLDGSLQAEIASGDAVIQISNLDGDSSVTIGKGALTLQIPQEPKFRLTAKTELVKASPNFKIDVSEDTVKIGEGSPVFSCTVNDGHIKIEEKDWFSSLGLK